MIAILAAAAAAAAPVPDAQTRLTDLRHMYAQACDTRAYATFDDLCDRLKRQLRDAEKAAEREARRQKKDEPALAFSGEARTRD